jgi:Ca2+/Na+ antiporter
MNEENNLNKDLEESQNQNNSDRNIPEEKRPEDIKPADAEKQDEQNTFGNRFWKLIRRHPLVFILLLFVIFLVIWGLFRINSQKKAFTKEKTELISTYENQLDSLKLNRIELATKTFSWAVRSEMMRNNIENINELFNRFIRTSDAKLLQLIDTKTNTVVLSTDKKFQGQRFTTPSFISLEIESTIRDSVSTKVYTPIMGINEMLGLLIAEFEN